MTQHFPFSAVIGQDQLKLALLLNAVDPQLGGVLITGPRGTGKSTLARGLADIAGFEAEQFVNLPLGASEEKLTGSLNLEKALSAGEVDFSPGLLARAHQGALYVDEVNLLPDALVDLLLDVAASGINHVERDGISHQHPARFILIGTMNPDEGELRPQLLDRFGLCVEINARLTPQQRVQAVQHRLAFDDDPHAFAQTYADSQTQLRQQISQARQHLQQAMLDDTAQLAIAELCAEAGVEGLRADICLQRASRAYAAWQGLGQVDQSCIDAVAELVLSHRRQTALQPQKNQQQNQQAQNQSSDKSGEGAADNISAGSDSASGSWGQMPPSPVGFGGADSTLSPFRDKKKLR